MNFIWLIYWTLLLISLIFSIYIIIKKNILLGLIQAMLTITFPIYTFIYVMHRNFVGNESEFSFILKAFLKGKPEAIFVVLLLMILIGIFIYNIFTLCIKKKFCNMN